MSRIDFHSNVSNQLEYACRLARKAYGAGCKLVVRHQNQEQLAEFDRLLWAFSETDFLPHVASTHPLAAETAIVLSLETADQPVYPHNEILLNLSDQVPADFARFERLIEIVPKETEATEAGRTRYRYYQQQGLPLNHILAK